MAGLVEVEVEVEVRVRPRWWAIPMLHLAVLFRSSRLVRLVRDRGLVVDFGR